MFCLSRHEKNAEKHHFIHRKISNHSTILDKKCTAEVPRNLFDIVVVHELHLVLASLFCFCSASVLAPGLDLFARRWLGLKWWHGFYIGKTGLTIIDTRI